MTKTSISFYACCLLIVNTLSGQNVASDQEFSLNWQLSTQSIRPLISNASLSSHSFNGVILPALSGSFPSATRNKIEFYDLEYVVLQGYESYKSQYLSKLRGTIQPIVYHTLAGNQGFTGFYICPFKEIGGTYYILKSYKYRTQEAEAFALNNAGVQNAKRAVTQSVLDMGTVYKFSVSKDGLYKLDASMLTAAGINLSSINPKNIKLYGHHGGMLPEKVSDFRYEDLVENAILVFGENDGKFDNGDYVLFYAQAPTKWKYNPSDNHFMHETNIYSDKSYFFLTVDGNAGKRISSKSSGNTLTADQTFNWYDYYELHEDEKENVCREGRITFGEKFDQTLVYNFNHNLQGISNDRELRFYYHAGAVAPSATNMTVKANGSVDMADFYKIGEYDCFSSSYRKTFTVPQTNNVQLSFTYNKPNSSSKAWLDYYELHCSKGLTYSEAFMGFRNSASATTTVAEYRLTNLPTGAFVYDVSDPVNVMLQPTFSDNGEFVFRDQPLGKIKQYVLSDGNFSSPQFEGQVERQNLHGLGIYQFIIVSPKEFTDAANKLAQYHRDNDQMDVLVVTPQQIYNEFSSGSQDITAIRDFFRFMYYKNTNPANRLKYAMFLGDASYDYKNKVPDNSNYVPTYESDAILQIPQDQSTYYVSDDFFGYLDSTDGTWFNEQKLEIAVTRLPVASPEEAMGVVNKLLIYKAPVSIGDWRNFVTLCADDADAVWEKNFVNDFELISKLVDTTFKNVNIRKVYLDAYKQENLGGSQRYPEAQAAIKKEFEQGTLIFNYIGHGGEEYLSSEKVFDIPLINAMNNASNLPVFFTATCEFSRFDDAMRKSAGEFVMTNVNGGAVAMFTTTRVVFEDQNAALTTYFWSSCAYVKIGGKWPTLGEIYVKLKNRNGQNGNDRRFTLFADPAMTMNYPEHVVKIDSINQSGIANQKDTIKALSKVTFKGHIEDVFGNKQSGFNGTILPIVYDKQSTFSTLSNDLPNQPIPFKLYSNILYKGENSVTNGEYTFSFVVPKDINYNYGYGKISMYADNGTTDASGHYKELVIGGTSSNASQDAQGPQIELFIDDYTFIDGGLTDNNPLLLARVFDENGINTSGIGIGRDIVAIIDKGSANEKRYVLNNYYKAKLNSYTSGDISYLLEGLEAGNHTYTLKVWDVYNNSSEATINFVIKNNEDFTIQHVLNYPNPFSSNTTFHFDHNRAGENLHVVITILTISGKVLKTIDELITNAESHVDDLTWNGKDDFDDKPARGVYIYRVTVTTEDGKKAEKVEKLVILN